MKVMLPYAPAVSVVLLYVTSLVGGSGLGRGGTGGTYGLGRLTRGPMPGLPVFETPLVGQVPMDAGRFVAMLPLICVLVPPTFTLPFAPTLPFAVTMLLGGFVGVPAVFELKLPVLAPPAMSSATQPGPVANKPPGKLDEVGVCASSCCTIRRAPLGVTAMAVTM